MLLFIKNYKIDLIFIGLATIPIMLSLTYDIYCVNNNHYFQRSGSLMVIFSVILEFIQLKYQVIKSSDQLQLKREGKIWDVLYGKDLPIERIHFQKIAFALMILGTLIWGYGDLPFLVP